MENSDTEILFGIALFDVEVTMPDKNLNKKMWSLVGTYINLIDKYYDLRQTIGGIHNI